jgi:hypothetical protein
MRSPFVAAVGWRLFEAHGPASMACEAYVLRARARSSTTKIASAGIA